MEILGDAATLSTNSGKIEVRHNDQRLLFHYSAFKKENLEKNDVFSHINRFWKAKPIPFQEAVFESYRKIADYFFQINDKKHLDIMLTKEVANLFRIHPFKDMRNWIVYNSGITLPPSILPDYKPDTDRDYTPEKTYVVASYWDLVTYAFMLRMCVPFWSYYTRIIKDDAGTGLKEHKAFELLRETELYNHPVTQKMEAYIQANNKKQVVRSGAIGLLAPEDSPRLIMVIFCARRLYTTELQYKEPNATLVSALFNFTKSSNSEGNFQDRYKDKGGKEGGGDEADGNKVSVYERHRNSTVLSIEEVAEYETALKGVVNDVKRLCPTLPMDLLERSMYTSRVLLTVENLVTTAMPCQKTILGWILSPIISPQGIPYQRPETIIRYMALAEAMLWYRGFHFLSLLMTARTPAESVHHVTTQPIRARLTDENHLALKTIFPHVRVIQNRKSDPREESDIINAIDEISGEIGEYAWIVTADESMLMALQRSKSTRLNISPEVRNDLARLIISLANNSFYTDL